MFGILLSHENVPKIESRQLTLTASDRSCLDVYLALKGSWYFISGYVDRRGAVMDWTVLPAYIFERNYDYDDEMIKTNWVQVFRD